MVSWNEGASAQDVGIRMWDMAKQTKMAAAKCNLTFTFLLVSSMVLLDGAQVKTKLKTNKLSLMLFLTPCYIEKCHS